MYSTNKILALGDITLCLYNYRPPTKLREGNVFSRICLSRGVDIGTALHPPPPDMGPPGPGSPASDIWWPSLEICSNLFIEPHCTGLLSPTSTDIWWPLKYIRLASGRYASLWNAFLLFNCVLSTND